MTEFVILCAAALVAGAQNSIAGGGTLVNGSVAPVLIADRGRLRFRVLNATDQQVISIGFADNRQFQQIASDDKEQIRADRQAGSHLPRFACGEPQKQQGAQAPANLEPEQDDGKGEGEAPSHDRDRPRRRLGS